MPERPGVREGGEQAREGSRKILSYWAIYKCGRADKELLLSEHPLTWGRIAVRYTAYNSLVASSPELRPMAAVLPDTTPPPSCTPMRMPQATLLQAGAEGG